MDSPEVAEYEGQVPWSRCHGTSRTSKGKKKQPRGWSTPQGRGRQAKTVDLRRALDPRYLTVAPPQPDPAPAVQP
jgi:hypothetical protein